MGIAGVMRTAHRDLHRVRLGQRYRCDETPAEMATLTAGHRFEFQIGLAKSTSPPRGQLDPGAATVRSDTRRRVPPRSASSQFQHATAEDRPSNPPNSAANNSMTASGGTRISGMRNHVGWIVRIDVRRIRRDARLVILECLVSRVLRRPGGSRAVDRYALALPRRALNDVAVGGDDFLRVLTRVLQLDGVERRRHRWPGPAWSRRKMTVRNTWTASAVPMIANGTASTIANTSEPRDPRR